MDNYLHDDILAAARLVRDCPKATLRENCIRQIDQNRLLKNSLPEIARLLGVAEPLRVLEWRNTDEPKVEVPEISMIDTLTRPFHIVVGGSRGPLEEVVSGANDLEAEPTIGIGQALAGQFVAMQGVRTVMRLGELGRMGRIPMEKVVRASDMLKSELPASSSASRGTMFKACRNFVMQNRDIMTSLGFSDVLHVGIGIGAHLKKAWISLAWSLGSGGWSEDTLFRTSRDELFRGDTLLEQVKLGLAKIRPMIFA